MYKWSFRCTDNGGYHQFFTVKARSKAEAIEKAFTMARKHARGDIYPTWECKLVSTF